MKKAAVIGSPALHNHYKTALERAGCTAVIFPDSSYVRKHPGSFDGLLLPGGGDVFSSLSRYMPFLEDIFPGCREREENDRERIPFYRKDFSPCRKKQEETARSSTDLLQRNSRSSVDDDFQLTLEQFRALHFFEEQKKPVFGICKGMQLINLYFHGTIKEVSNPRLHRHPGKDAFHPADNLPGNLLHALFGPHMLINSCHHQCIDLLGQNLQVTQIAPDTTVEAVSHLSYPVFGTQWHPERMPEISGQDALLLFRYFVSLL